MCMNLLNTLNQRPLYTVFDTYIKEHIYIYMFSFTEHFVVVVLFKVLFSAYLAGAAALVPGRCDPVYGLGASWGVVL